MPPFKTVVVATAIVLLTHSGAVAEDAPASGDPEAGQRVFNKCKACHQVGEGARNGVGPELNGVIGRHSGSVPGYNYSDANKASGLTWDVATFDAYIRDPRAKVPGTKMSFLGLSKQREIDDLVAYLQRFGPDGRKAP